MCTRDAWSLCAPRLPLCVDEIAYPCLPWRNSVDIGKLCWAVAVFSDLDAVHKKKLAQQAAFAPQSVERTVLNAAGSVRAEATRGSVRFGQHDEFRRR
jgi:hypothetical protein